LRLSSSPVPRGPQDEGVVRFWLSPPSERQKEPFSAFSGQDRRSFPERRDGYPSSLFPSPFPPPLPPKRYRIALLVRKSVKLLLLFFSLFPLAAFVGGERGRVSSFPFYKFGFRAPRSTRPPPSQNVSEKKESSLFSPLPPLPPPFPLFGRIVWDSLFSLSFMGLSVWPSSSAEGGDGRSSEPFFSYPFFPLPFRRIVLSHFLYWVRARRAAVFFLTAPHRRIRVPSSFLLFLFSFC